MLLNTNFKKLQFTSIYLYSDTVNPQLYIRLFDSLSYNEIFRDKELLAAGLSVEQQKRNNLYRTNLIRVDGVEAITKIIRIFTSRGLLENIRESELNKFIRAQQNSGMSANKPIIHQEQHNQVALQAAESGDLLCLQVLLGNNMSSTHVEGIASPDKSDWHCGDFEEQALEHLIEALDIYEAQADVENRTLARLVMLFAQAIRDAKEQIIALEIKEELLRRKSLTDVPRKPINEFEFYIHWVSERLDNFFYKYLGKYLYMSGLPELEDLRRELFVQKNNAADAYLNRLRFCTERAKQFEASVQFIKEKKSEYEKLLAHFMGQRTLPAIYAEFKANNSDTALASELRMARVSPNVCDQNGNTLLHYLVRRKDRAGMVDMVVRRGGSLAALNNAGQTPAIYANVTDGCIQIFMMQNGSKVYARVEEILESYEPHLRKMIIETRSAITEKVLRAARDKERIDSYNFFMNSLFNARRAGDVEIVIRAIQQHGVKFRGKKSRLYDPLKELVDSYTKDPSAWGVQEVFRSDAVLVLNEAVVKLSGQLEETKKMVHELRQERDEKDKVIEQNKINIVSHESMREREAELDDDEKNIEIQKLQQLVAQLMVDNVANQGQIQILMRQAEEMENEKSKETVEELPQEVDNANQGTASRAGIFALRSASPSAGQSALPGLTQSGG